MFIVFLISQLLTSHMAYAYDDMDEFRRPPTNSSAAIGDDKHDNGYIAPVISDDKHDNGYTNPDSAAYGPEDAKRDYEAKYCTTEYGNWNLQNCKKKFYEAQAANNMGESIFQWGLKASACKVSCLEEIPMMAPCTNTSRKLAQSKIRSFMKQMSCASPPSAPTASAEVVFNTSKVQLDNGDGKLEMSSETRPDGDGYRSNETCIQNSDKGAPGVCELTSAIGVSSVPEKSYFFTDINGHRYPTMDAAARSNRALLMQGPQMPAANPLFSATNLRGSIAEAAAPVTSSVVPRARPAATVPADGGSSPAAAPAGNGTTAANNSGTTPSGNSQNDPLQPLASNNNNGTLGNGGVSTGSMGVPSGPSYGEASMFPSLQSAKVSAFGSSETTSSSGRSLASPSGGSSRGGGSGGYKSFAGGSPPAVGNSSEVSSGTAQGSAGNGGGRGFGGSGSSGPGFSSSGGPVVNVASVAGERNDGTPSLKIGDQGFYKPGGGAAGGGGKIGPMGFTIDKNGKRTKRLKSIGGCAPGNLQCVLATIGSPNAVGKMKRLGSRKIASEMNGNRLPAGVTGGAEDIFSRLVYFHNHNINLDHEGLIDNGDGGFE